MEIVTRVIKTPKKVIKAKEKTITVYIASDGRKFDNKRGCEWWEKSLYYDNLRASIKYKYSKLLSDIVYKFYYVGNEEQLKFMCSEYNYFHNRTKTTNNNKIKIGDWIGIVQDDEGFTTCVISLEEIKQAIKELEGD